MTASLMAVEARVAVEVERGEDGQEVGLVHLRDRGGQVDALLGAWSIAIPYERNSKARYIPARPPTRRCPKVLSALSTSAGSMDPLPLASMILKAS
jgi:hypothetical protein